MTVIKGNFNLWSPLAWVPPNFDWSVRPSKKNCLPFPILFLVLFGQFLPQKQQQNDDGTPAGTYQGDRSGKRTFLGAIFCQGPAASSHFICAQR